MSSITMPDDAKPATVRANSPRRRRRWSIILLVLVVLAAAIYFGGEAAVGPILRRRLQAMAASHLNAELRISSLHYHFPYGITLHDASLTTRGPDGQPFDLVKVRRLNLKLAELPKHTGPLVIERLILNEPSVQLIQTPDGLAGARDLVRHDAAPTIDLDKVKLSDMFRLRRFAIEGGQVMYTDPTQPNVKPMVWTGLQIDLNTAPQDGQGGAKAGAAYAYALDAQNAPFAHVTAKGTMNVDDLVLDVREFDFGVKVHPDDENSKLPAPVQALLKSNAIDGELRIKGIATVPLRDPRSSRYSATVDLPNASARLPQWGAQLDKLVVRFRVSSEELNVEGQPTSAATKPILAGEFATAAAATSAPSTRPADGPKAWVRIKTIEAVSGDTSLVIDKGVFAVDAVAQEWRCRDLLGTLTLGAEHRSLPTRWQELLAPLHCNGALTFTATAGGPLKPPPGTRPIDALDYTMLAVPRGLTIQPPGFPQPIEKLAGSIKLTPGAADVQNLEAAYGCDKVFVAGAHVDLTHLPIEVPVTDLNGSVEFKGQSQPYPKPIDGVAEWLGPTGLFTVTGNLIARAKVHGYTAYQLNVGTDGGALHPPLDENLATARRLPMSTVHGTAAVVGLGPTGTVAIPRLDSTVLDGRVAGSTNVTYRGPGKPLSYEAEVHVAELNLPKFAKVWARPGEDPPRLTGRGFSDFTAAGEGAHDGRGCLDYVHGKGEVEILDGDFWQIPLFSDLAAGAKRTKDALTVGQGAATVEFHDRVFDLTSAAVSAPVLGLQGTGQVGFDGQVNLRVIAAPLADWKDQLKRTGIPVVSDVAGAVAGGIQKILNGATRALLYEFRVTGTIQDPQLTTVPAPVLTQGAAELFGKMIEPGKGDQLIDQIRPKAKK